MASALLSLLLVLPSANAFVEETYTTNAVCRQQHCINPVFPGFDEMELLQFSTRWTKWGLNDVKDWMPFCGPLTNYNVAIPASADGSNQTMALLQEIVAAQDKKATRRYFYHLAGMGIEPWDNQDVIHASFIQSRECARKVARLTCATYFPMASTSNTDTMQNGVSVRYLPPCSSACRAYIDTCGVDCCDDSVKCSYNRQLNGVDVVVGYTDTAGCTPTGSGAVVDE